MATSCAECGGVAEPVPGRVIYPSRRDLHDRWFWRCACGAYVGCHRGSRTPLGTCAGPELRRMRNLAHAMFDRIWRGKGRGARSDAYCWMQKVMGLTPEAAHIGLLNADQCKALINHASEREDR